jgi:hypothetical protein
LHRHFDDVLFRVNYSSLISFSEVTNATQQSRSTHTASGGVRGPVREHS